MEMLAGRKYVDSFKYVFYQGPCEPVLFGMRLFTPKICENIFSNGVGSVGSLMTSISPGSAC